MVWDYLNNWMKHKTYRGDEGEAWNRDGEIGARNIQTQEQVRDKSLQYESVELQKELQKKHEEEIKEAISRVKKEQGTIKKERDSMANELEQSHLRD